MMNRIRVAPVVALAAVLGLTGCPRKEDQPPKPKVAADRPVAAAPAPARLAAPLPTMGPAPLWKLTDLNGTPISSDQFKGKVVVVDFWATWCPPCIGEIPGYVELERKYGKDGLAIIGVSIDEGGPEVVKSFATKHKVTYPLAMADETIVKAFGGFEAIPTTFLIDRQGQIRDKKIGSAEKEEYEKKIVSLLN